MDRFECLSSQGYSREVLCAFEAAVTGWDLYGGQEVVVSEKGDDDFGISKVTDVDENLQAHSLRFLRAVFPSAQFIVEEDSDDSSALSGAWIEAHGLPRLVFGIDPVCGTIEIARELPLFATSIGVALNGALSGGVINIPEVRGGVCVVGERGKGVTLFEHGKVRYLTRDLPWATGAEYVWLGRGVLQLPSFSRFAASLGDNNYQLSTTPSCGYGLAMVVLHRADCLVQPHQMPYDWMAGVPLVEETGGVIKFYHYRNGKVEFLDKPDLPSFFPETRETGFIAGKPEIVEYVSSLLVHSWGK
ncbi:MAG: inositol monophosphatase family protein [bacterium]|nr:inositol monophosphatase family protein [bacterium]